MADKDEKKLSPQKKWDKAHNYTLMGIRLYKSEADEFRDACKRAGVTQSGQVRSMMKDFVRDVNSRTPDK